MIQKNRTRPRTGVPLIVMAAVLWGTTGTSQALAPETATPLVIGTLRLWVGGAGLWMIALQSGGVRTGRTWPIGLTVLTALLVAGYQFSFFAAVSVTGVAVGTMVAIGSAPVFSGLLDCLQGQIPDKRWLGATLLAIIGSAMMLFSGGGGTVSLPGIFLALGAGLCYALYTLTLKHLLKTHPPQAVMAVVFSLGALLMTPLLLGTNLSWVITAKGALVVLHLGLLATALAYFLYAKGLQTTQASTVVSLSLAEPLTAALLGLFFLGETVSILALAGMGVLLGGLILLSLPVRTQ